MTVNSEHCDPKRITRFLDHELSHDALTELQRHLDSCVSCQSQLDDSTATTATWMAAAESLRDEPHDMESMSTVLTRGEAAEITRHVTDDGVRRVVELLAPTDNPQMLGRIGTYEVAGVIGSGGNGIVLKAHDPALNRYVAIKVLAPHLASSGAARQRFAREAQAAAAVVHENVIAIHGVAESQGMPYLVMPYERGQSLQRRIDDNGPLGVTEILRIGFQMASGLAAAHSQGLVHRDIKPANILLADGVERVTITDFGLARATDDASMTRSGVIAGTPQYMSPEQARGDSIDHRSDLFSFGSVLYTMCTGHPPFRAETSYGTLQRICQTRPRSILQSNAEVPSWLCRLVDKLHAKDPSERISSAGELADLLGQCLAHVQQPEAQRLPVILSRKETRDRSNKRLGLAAISGTLLLLAAIVVTGIQPSRNVKPSSNENLVPHASSTENAEEATTSLQQSQQSMPAWDDEVAESLLEVEEELDSLEHRASSLFGDPY